MEMKDSALGDFEATVLASLLNLGGTSYGVPIREEVEAAEGRLITIGALYITLDRMEKKGYVRSWESDPTPERGGRSKRFYILEGSGEAALRAKQEEYSRRANRLAEGLKRAPVQGIILLAANVGRRLCYGR